MIKHIRRLRRTYHKHRKIVARCVDLNSGKLFRLIRYIGLFSLVGLLFLTTLAHGWFGGLALLIVLIMVVIVKQKVVWKIYRKDISTDKRPIFDLIMKGVPLQKDSHPAYLTKEFYRKLKEFLDGYNLSQTYYG